MKSLDRAEARRLSPERLAELTESINDYTAIPVAPVVKPAAVETAPERARRRWFDRRPQSAPVDRDQVAVDRIVLVAASVISVAGVALIAGAISFGHMHDWAAVNGEPAWRQPLFPLSVDGLVIAGSVVLLADSLAGRRRDWLAYVLVTAGAAVSVAANVLHGWHHPIAATVIAAWPPLSLIGSYELLMRLLHRLRHPQMATKKASKSSGTPAAGTGPVEVPDSTPAVAAAAKVTAPVNVQLRKRPKTTRPRRAKTAAVIARSDADLLVILADPTLTPRDADGSVSVRAAKTALGIGADRARRLLAEADLLRNPNGGPTS
ncbi:DUF2637 domain-containing protein [Fodinicola feengrottensis]